MDFIDAEQLVASLFGDDDSSVSFEQPRQPTDNKKGFVTADHEDAAKWFYQDPQGVIQGEMCCFIQGETCCVLYRVRCATVFYTGWDVLLCFIQGEMCYCVLYRVRRATVFYTG